MVRPRWATRVVAQLHRLVARKLVSFTFKASQELRELALDEERSADPRRALGGRPDGADRVGEHHGVAVHLQA
jgi:hypothetical protein